MDWKKSNVINLKQLLIRFKNYVEIHIQYKINFPCKNVFVFMSVKFFPWFFPSSSGMSPEVVFSARYILWDPIGILTFRYSFEVLLGFPLFIRVVLGSPPLCWTWYCLLQFRCNHSAMTENTEEKGKEHWKKEECSEASGWMNSEYVSVTDE